MVGATIALALADSPITRHLKVCLIESSTPKLNLPLQPTPSIRVSAVSPASAAFFQRIGAWERMAAKRVTPFHKMHVWHTERHGRIEWDLRQMRGEQVEPARLAESETTNETDSALGWIIENDVIQNSLWEAMAELMSVNGGPANLEILSPVKIDKIQSGASDGDAATSDWPHLILSNGQHVRTRLLIGADGPNSIVKQFSSGTIDTIGKDYGQRAVVATLQLEPTSSSKNDIAYQRFLPTGPIALLPCHEEYVNLVWSTTPAHAQYLTAKTTTPEEFVQLVNQAIQAEPEQFHPSGREERERDCSRLCLGEFILSDLLPSLILLSFSLTRLSSLLPSPLTSVTDFLFPPLRPTSLPSVTRVFGPRLSFPLRLQQSSSYRSDRVALAGDAAHVIHPMAGQGVNLGLGDAEALVNTIETNVTSGLDIGTRDNLTPYDMARWSHTSCILGGVDAIGSAFQLGGPLAQIRSIGLDLFSAVPAIKKKAAKTAMGIKP